MLKVEEAEEHEWEFVYSLSLEGILLEGMMRLIITGREVEFYGMSQKLDSGLFKLQGKANVRGVLGQASMPKIT